jgi:hypothetical protein
MTVMIECEVNQWIFLDDAKKIYFKLKSKLSENNFKYHYFCIKLPKELVGKKPDEIFEAVCNELNILCSYMFEKDNFELINNAYELEIIKEADYVNGLKQILGGKE